MKVFAINGSPRRAKGNTGLILNSFLEGISQNGAEVELIYASRHKLKPCACGEMQCWYLSPGKCCIRDDMDLLYPKLREADLLVIASPVYIPLPGDLQNLLNRLCPLVEPRLEFRDGRTRARFRQDVNIKKIVLVATGGWWEVDNMSSLLSIVAELAENASVEFGGAVLRPHAFLMKSGGEVTPAGQEILNAVSKAGNQLIREGKMDQEILDQISRPLITEADLRDMYNQWL